MSVKFFLKTGLYLISPWRFGHLRQWENLREQDYDHERDKHPVRRKHHGESGWKAQPAGEGVTYRDYSNYGEYVTHQKQKLAEILKKKGGFTNRMIAGFRWRFYRRFHILDRYLSKDAVILCAGARQGTEVEVLRELGFKNAYGLDLEPGPGNPYVRPGDFMKLTEGTSSVDMVYSNCVDHAFDLESFFREHARAVKPDGYAMYDLGIEEGGAFEAVQWERPEELVKMLIGLYDSVVCLQTEPNWKWVLVHGSRVSE